MRTLIHLLIFIAMLAVLALVAIIPYLFNIDMNHLCGFLSGIIVFMWMFVLMLGGFICILGTFFLFVYGDTWQDIFLSKFRN